MTIAMSVMTTGSNLHGTINPTPWELMESVQRFFGLTGEYHLIGRLSGRNLSAWMQFRGYNSQNALLSAVTTLNNQIGEAGTVTYTVGTDVSTFAGCIFMGFEPEEDPWVDASGVNGWQIKGRLKWRQVKG